MYMGYGLLFATICSIVFRNRIDDVACGWSESC